MAASARQDTTSGGTCGTSQNRGSKSFFSFPHLNLSLQRLDEEQAQSDDGAVHGGGHGQRPRSVLVAVAISGGASSHGTGDHQGARQLGACTGRPEGGHEKKHAGPVAQGGRHRQALGRLALFSEHF